MAPSNVRTPSYTISHQAYVKMMLHAAKHPHKPANGVLLGSKSSTSTVFVSDAVPLLHMWTSLSPMMEIGLDLAKTYAKSQDLLLVGYYQATERLHDTALAPVGEKVASKIREGFSDAVALVIDGENIASGEPALIPYISAGPSWRPESITAPPFGAASAFTLESTRSPRRALELIREHGRHRQFGDFDDHLENVEIDWLRNASCVDDLPGGS